MEEKTTKRIILFVAGFYVLIAAMAVCILSLSGSVFKAQGADNLIDYMEKNRALTEERAEQLNETDSDAKLEGLEALLGDTVADLEEESKEEVVIEKMSGKGAEEQSTEEPVSEEPVSEEPAPEETQEDRDILPEEKHFYSFTTNNVTTDLRMREEASDTSPIVYRLRPGTTGYVIYLGDEWSWVYADGYEGYCANEFLALKEISEEDYPEELKNGS